MVAISPAAKTSPMIIEAIIAIVTSKSAFMSSFKTRPKTQSLNIGIPHKITAIEAI